MAATALVSWAAQIHAAGGSDTDSATLDTTGVVDWGVKNIIPILLLIIGINIIAGARKGRLSENAATLTNVLIGAGVIAGAAFIYGFAGNLTNVIFGG